MKLKKFIFRSVNSTNDTAIKIIKSTKNNSGIVFSENQKKGKGQYGNKWISLKGNLFVSIFFKLEEVNYSLKDMTKINCQIIKKFFYFYYKKKISIKLPNDLKIQGKKISGILQETIMKDNIKFLVVGIGINLIKSPKIKNYPTTNLFELTNNTINNKDVFSRLIKIYEIFIPRFSSSKQELMKKFK